MYHEERQKRRLTMPENQTLQKKMSILILCFQNSNNYYKLNDLFALCVVYSSDIMLWIRSLVIIG
mgnify:CR=1 FL=1